MACLKFIFKLWLLQTQIIPAYSPPINDVIIQSNAGEPSLYKLNELRVVERISRFVTPSSNAVGRGI